MEREVTVRKLRELEASNPAIPTVTLTDEPQGNSGNPIAPETLTPSFNPTLLPRLCLPPLPSAPLLLLNPHVQHQPSWQCPPCHASHPSFKPSPPPIFPPSPDATVTGRLFSPSYLARRNGYAGEPGWVKTLRAMVIRETTINHYLKNIAQFLDYVAATPPPTCRLSKRVLFAIRREVRMMLRCMKRPVTLHQMTVKRAKDGQLISKALLEKCRDEARKRIPKILDELEKDKAQKTQFRLYGYVTAFLASIYGHRCGVFQNMTIDEVRNATKTASTYLINVSMHKTNQAFGPAQIALSAQEYDWFERFLGMKEELVGGAAAKYVFFTSTLNPCKNLNNYFQAAWAEMGLPKSPTFTDLRSAIATHARNNGTVEDRSKMSRFMCHDTRTADKFYACNLNTKEAWEHRQLFEKVLEGSDVPDQPVRKVGKRPCKRKRCDVDASPLTSQSTSEDEAEPVYQESGVSSVESDENSSEAEPSMIQPMRQATIILTPLKMRWSPAKSMVLKSLKEYPSRA
ncbi:hypothetical protein IRJ41_010362 [Triplophysa rosa]|uniref:Uncharacterized protein n=1 Tax=Triplophysa rosa TaxID=992332 RepID=A0A9W7T2X6_TRIRA|nr:hypothetical protein IRJ41_010362 [Triplophysa rosa]